MIAHEQGGFHRLGGNLKSLHDEGRAEKRKNHGHQQRLDIFAHRGVSALLGSRRFRAVLRDWCYFSHSSNTPSSSLNLFRAEPFERLRRRRLFRFLLIIAHAGSVHQTPNIDPHPESFLMIGPSLLNNGITWRRQTSRLQKFLERRLMVG